MPCIPCSSCDYCSRPILTPLSPYLAPSSFTTLLGQVSCISRTWWDPPRSSSCFCLPSTSPPRCPYSSSSFIAHRICSHLIHPPVPRRLMLVYEMAPGGSLLDWLRGTKPKGMARRSLPWPVRHKQAHEVAEGLVALGARGMLHGALHPGNIVLDRSLHARLVHAGIVPLLLRLRRTASGEKDPIPFSLSSSPPPPPPPGGRDLRPCSLPSLPPSPETLSPTHIQCELWFPTILSLPCTHPFSPVVFEERGHCPSASPCPPSPLSRLLEAAASLPRVILLFFLLPLVFLHGCKVSCIPVGSGLC